MDLLSDAVAVNQFKADGVLTLNKWGYGITLGTGVDQESWG